MANETMRKAIKWIYENTIDGKGICVTNKYRVVYPEVSGYYIPSLLGINEVELAKAYAKHLCDIQKADGSWYDPGDKYPYIFDTGQILKGLVAIRQMMPEVDEHIGKGIEWIFSQMNEEGRLIQPNSDIWGNNDFYCNDLIHIYCMSPIFEAAKAFDKPEWAEKADKVLDYYISNNYNRIVHFSLFSHFYAYVVEGLIDCGRVEIAKEAMNNFEKYRSPKGACCAWNNVKWVCSTSLFQFSIIWYKLGEKDKANLTYNYACSLQNKSGGWYGSYYNFFDFLANIKKRNLYEKKQEISWAVKFYIDASILKGEV